MATIQNHALVRQLVLNSRPPGESLCGQLVASTAERGRIDRDGREMRERCSENILVEWVDWVGGVSSLCSVL